MHGNHEISRGKFFGENVRPFAQSEHQRCSRTALNHCKLVAPMRTVPSMAKAELVLGLRPPPNAPLGVAAEGCVCGATVRVRKGAGAGPRLTAPESPGVPVVAGVRTNFPVMTTGSRKVTLLPTARNEYSCALLRSGSFKPGMFSRLRLLLSGRSTALNFGSNSAASGSSTLPS